MPNRPRSTLTARAILGVLATNVMAVGSMSAQTVLKEDGQWRPDHRPALTIPTGNTRPAPARCRRGRSGLISP